jgi:hypothetical protein
MKNTIQRPLADVLWEAANVHLSFDQYPRDGQTKFTCIATDIAECKPHHKKGNGHIWLETSMCVLQSMFCKFDEGEERQGVRYMWLLLAMHVAEDEGVMVEVAA